VNQRRVPPHDRESTGCLYAVVPAAGIGSRMNSDTPKQFIAIDGLSVLSHTIDRLLQVESIKAIVVVLDKAINNPKVSSCIGGASRAESVRNGLLHLEATIEPECSVLVHDAARPCVRVNEISRLVSETAGSDDGGLLAMPVIDTIKRADIDLRVTETVDRDHLWRAATPQLFKHELLLSALTGALEEGVSITDEASAMQYTGYRPRLIECSADNIKVTTPTDLALAEHYLAAQRRHAFCEGDHVMLCGVKVPHNKGFKAHSDGDVALHALTDAILGACALGKLSALIDSMCEVIAVDLNVDRDRVNVKATTSEKLGFIGREEGIAAQAVVTVVSDIKS